MSALGHLAPAHSSTVPIPARPRQALAPFTLTALAVGGLPQTDLAAALVAKGMGGLAAAQEYFGIPSAEGSTMSSLATWFVPSDAAVNAFLQQVGLPAGRASLDRLLELSGSLKGVEGFSTGNDQFSAFAPTVLSLLHAAVSQYSFVAGA